MMKTGATAMLAMATLAGSAAAQDTCAPLWAQCLGPEAADNVPCCSSPDVAVSCVQKNDQYAQCRPAVESGTGAPLGWMGNVLTTPNTIGATPTAADAEADADAEDEADFGDAEVEEVAPEAEEDGPIIDAVDIVEMGLAPPGMDAEDIEEMGMVDELAAELIEDDEDEEDVAEVREVPIDAEEDGEEDDEEEEQVVEVPAGETMEEREVVIEDGEEDDEDEEQVVEVPAGETMEEAAAVAETPVVPAVVPTVAPVVGAEPFITSDDLPASQDQFINFPGFDYVPNGANLVAVSVRSLPAPSVIALHLLPFFTASHHPNVFKRFSKVACAAGHHARLRGIRKGGEPPGLRGPLQRHRGLQRRLLLP